MAKLTKPDPVEHKVDWSELDKKFSGLATAKEHEVLVQREAIPIIFVPGIMGTRLRRTGTSPSFPYNKKERVNGQPPLRWDPDSNGFMFKWYIGAEPNERRALMIGASGSKFTSSYLEPDDSNPVARGLQPLLMTSYKKVLGDLRDHDWGPLGKAFTFPVYGFGYNWTDTCFNAGKLLAKRIKDIIAEAKAETGKCEQVILVTHSMGGLVSRSASQLHNAAGDILGIIHGVQPVTGSAVAYWRIKAGFEGARMASSALGNNGRKTTVLLGNMPGGLELLPTTRYTTGWLRVTQKGANLLVPPPPSSDPYKEIYEERTEYWGLIDQNLLDPDRPAAPPPAPPNSPNGAMAGAVGQPWDEYIASLAIAKKFHDSLKLDAHAARHRPRDCRYHRAQSRVEQDLE